MYINNEPSNATPFIKIHSQLRVLEPDEPYQITVKLCKLRLFPWD